LAVANIEFVGAGHRSFPTTSPSSTSSSCDGTPEGTHLIADINPGSGSSTAQAGAISSPPQSGFVSLGNGRALFAATDDLSGFEPWVTDGTVKGTHLVADINPGPDNGTPQYSFGSLSLGDGRALFTATDGVHGNEPWVTDGTAAGTQLLANINLGAAGAGALSFFDLGGGRALFLAKDAAHGHEPWVTDGTPGGTHLLADINLGPEGSFAGVGGFVALNDHHVLFAASQGTSRDLWVTDGTSQGTHLAVKLDAGANSSDPRDFASLGDGRALFSFSTSSSGRELWVTDGTTEGTHLVTDINPGASDSFPGKFESFGNGQALFTADDGTHGQELWLTNGIAEGTHLLADLNSGTPSSKSEGFAVVAEKSVPTMGDDIITGTGSTDTLFGDTSKTLSDSVEGGNDQISGLGDADILLGDASTLSGHARGGDDRLSGGEGNDILSGDAVFMFDNEKGGHDTFVFDDAFGNDTVRDFRQGEDTLEFNVSGLNNTQNLEIASVGFDTVITAGTSGTVTLLGFTGSLTDMDFIFV
jgi:ELWxxDGT repeat protein